MPGMQSASFVSVRVRLWYGLYALFQRATRWKRINARTDLGKLFASFSPEQDAGRNCCCARKAVARQGSVDRLNYEMPQVQ